MKLNWIVDFKWNELDKKLIFDLVTDIGMFVAILFYNPIAQLFQLRYAPGFGVLKIIALAFFSLRILMDYIYIIHYGE